MLGFDFRPSSMEAAEATGQPTRDMAPTSCPREMVEKKPSAWARARRPITELTHDSKVKAANLRPLVDEAATPIQTFGRCNLVNGAHPTVHYLR
jgi:hypothetical protein